MGIRYGVFRRLVLCFVFSWFLLGGIAHFAFTDFEAAIIPPWLPDHRFLVLVSGVFELLGASGILFRYTRSVAGWGLVILTAAVTPANIYMLQQAAQYPAIPVWALVLRLPLQALLMAGIWWSTRLVTSPGNPPISQTSRKPARPDFPA